MKNKILLVDDFPSKAESILNYLNEEFPSLEIVQKESYKSGLYEICTNGGNYDLILLDMSMPTFDFSAEENGGEPEPVAGKLILENMNLRDINIKVLVVTMYENFDGMRLAQLNKELKTSFSDIYIGNVFFSFKQNDWKRSLSDFITEIYGK